MLKKLRIQNYAIINELEIEFSGKLNIITGETGAGKSILMGALSLILGERADTSVLLNREKKSVVEGSFDSSGKKNVHEWMISNDLDAEDELFIRREIAVNGKSRAFVNDTPVNLEQLRQLSSLLVDLHRQFDTLALGESDFQREVLDALAGHMDKLEQYQSVYAKWKQNQHELAALQQQKDQFNKEYDYNKFLYEELEEAGLKENELENADAELKLLSHAEDIKTSLSKLVDELGEGEEPMVQQLKSLLHQVQPYADYHNALPAILQRLQSAAIELEDIGYEAAQVNDHISYDPDRIMQLNDKIATGYKLLKKHGAHTTKELLSIKKSLNEKLQAVLNIDEAIASKLKLVHQLEKEATEYAKEISAGRNSQIKPFIEKVNKLLVRVGMPNARIQVSMQDSELNAYGKDAVEFLFDANLPAGEDNKSSRFEYIRKVASGGELSRLMLCIKSLVAQSLDLPTLIFDEIDTGISGEAARQVGIIIKELAAMRQVISITHQPQIAGRADAHFQVYKEIKDQSIQTSIRFLTKEERITVIAKMLSGEKPTAAALENAREILMN